MDRRAFSKVLKAFNKAKRPSRIPRLEDPPSVQPTPPSAAQHSPSAEAGPHSRSQERVNLVDLVRHRLEVVRSHR